MGLSTLRLVTPDDFPSPIASARATSALDVLNAASQYESFEDAIGDCRLVVGTSARLRSPVLSTHDASRNRPAAD